MGFKICKSTGIWLIWIKWKGFIGSQIWESVFGCFLVPKHPRIFWRPYFNFICSMRLLCDFDIWNIRWFNTSWKRLNVIISHSLDIGIVTRTLIFDLVIGKYIFDARSKLSDWSLSLPCPMSQTGQFSYSQWPWKDTRDVQYIFLWVAEITFGVANKITFCD